MLTVHHLQRSQSERIVWLCEELALPPSIYTLVLHARRPDNGLSPDSLKVLHPAGTAPVITDGPVVLAESQAIAEFIVNKYGRDPATKKPRLTVTLEDGEGAYADYLYWLNFANGTFQCAISRNMNFKRVEGLVPAENPVRVFVLKKLESGLDQLEAQLVKVEGEVGQIAGTEPGPAYLCGHDLTLADIMTVFSLTTMRGFYSLDLSGWPAVLRYLQRIGKRDAYQRAMERGDPGLTPMLGATVQAIKLGK
ncbi:glutathione S-transferase [Athelia psychrophila]|uniref:Glutathione S-transferase n=1 Tax=Athelia psychrophila TaxID=1759441 RepID=A0A166SCS4_9AGAM|nr:glutathione S-transferase [Fibularhizoctonia sp. CBS 109695]KZP29298.1 glutathione S-transferase [Fibularhizoctonia sp. CBS 109695]